MKNGKTVTGLIIGIVFLLILLVASWALYFHHNDITIALMEKKANLEYEPIFLSNYATYTDFLAKYHLWGKLKPRDFQTKDYIVDFIPYNKNLEILKVEIRVGEIVNINYQVNQDLKESNKVLINLIPIEKNIIKNFNQIKHEYKEVR